MPLQIIEACWASRAANGGLLELSALVKAVNKRRGSVAEDVSTDDVVGCSVMVQHLVRCGRCTSGTAGVPFGLAPVVLAKHSVAGWSSFLCGINAALPGDLFT